MLNFTQKSDIAIQCRFLKEWMGNIEGSEKFLWELVANKLLERGVVEFVKKEKEVKKQDDKAFRRPIKDKMVKETKNK